MWNNITSNESSIVQTIFSQSLKSARKSNEFLKAQVSQNILPYSSNLNIQLLFDSIEKINEISRTIINVIIETNEDPNKTHKLSSHADYLIIKRSKEDINNLLKKAYWTIDEIVENLAFFTNQIIKKLKHKIIDLQSTYKQLYDFFFAGLNMTLFRFSKDIRYNSFNYFVLNVLKQKLHKDKAYNKIFVS